MTYYIIHIYRTNGDKIERRTHHEPTDMIQYLTASGIDPNTVAQFDYFTSEEPYFWAYKWGGAKWVIDRRGIEQSFK